jgi:hypothetical protein
VGSENSREELEEFFDSSGLRRRRPWCERVAAEGDLRQFIYPIPLTEWVSNLIPMNKKKGTIRVCMDFKDLNKSCPKNISLHHLLTKLLMSV